MKPIITLLIVIILLSSSVYADFLTTTKIVNPSGWEDNGSTIRTLTDRPVDISGNMSVDGIADFNGNVTIGDGFDNGGIDLTTQGNILLAGDILIQGDILTIVDQEINGTFSPTEDNKFNLGSTIKRWKDAFFSNTIIALLFSGNNSQWSRDSSNVFLTTITDNVGIGNTIPNATLHISGNVIADNILENGTDVFNFTKLYIDQAKIEMGNVGDFTGLDDAMTIDNLIKHATGSVIFALVDEVDGKILATWQEGLADAAGFHRNSRITSSDFGIKNATKLSRCSEMAEQMGGPDGLDLDGVGCNSTQLGASLLQEGSIRVGHRLVVGGGNKSTYGIQVLGFASFNLEGNNFDIFNGSVHPQTPRIEEVGFAVGELVTMIDEDFEDNDISPFQKREQVGSDLDNWDADEDLDFCFDDLCARARGGNSRAPRIMELNVSTVDRNKLNISFWIGARQIDTVDNLSVQVIEGSNSIMVYNFTGLSAGSNTDIEPPEFITALIPSSFDDKSKVSIRFNMSANFGGTGNSREEFWVDNVKMVGSATDSTRANVTRRDTVFLLGNGNQRIFWNDSSKVLELPPNATIISETIQDLIVSGTLTLGSDKISGFEDLKHLKNNTPANFTTLLVQEPPAECPSGTFMTYTNMSTSICVASSGGTSVWNSSGGDIFLNDSTGSLGIRKVPTVALDVAGSLTVTGDIIAGEAVGDQFLANALGSNSFAQYSFQGDEDTGLRRLGSNSMVMLLGGTQIFRLDSGQMGTVASSFCSAPELFFANDINTGITSESGGDNLQFCAGLLTFMTFDESTTDVLTINENGVDIDFRIEGDNEPNLLFIDGGSDNNISFFGGYVSTGFTFNSSGGLRMSGDLIIDGTCTAEGADCASDIAERMHSKGSFDNTTCTVTAEHIDTIVHKYFNMTQEECSYELVGSFYEYVCNDVSVKVEYQDESEVCVDEYRSVGNNQFEKVIQCHNDTATYSENEFRTIPKKVDCNLNQNFNLEFESGDVVCSDTDSQKIKFCDSAYDTSVIGVVNYEATMILNQRAPYPVTLAGNIPVKVKCDIPINIGDLLVSSNTQGYAQSIKTITPTSLAQVWNKMGSPFAKALESCSSGTKTIRALMK